MDEELRRAFQLGYRAATDPSSEQAIIQGGNATTTLYSFWLRRLCPVCVHTFRINDQVFIDGVQHVRHNSEELPCARNQVIAAEAVDETQAFFRGLEQVLPPPPGFHLVRLEAGHPLLSAPYRQFGRHRCVVCGHTLRLHDQVVICPCSRLEPQICNAAVHSDAIHGLRCLEAWNPHASEFDAQTYCPITSRRLGE